MTEIENLEKRCPGEAQASQDFRGYIWETDGFRNKVGRHRVVIEGLRSKLIGEKGSENSSEVKESQSHISSSPSSQHCRQGHGRIAKKILDRGQRGPK